MPVATSALLPKSPKRRRLVFGTPGWFSGLLQTSEAEKALDKELMLSCGSVSLLMD